MAAAFTNTMMEMLLMSGATLAVIILVIFLASRRRPSIRRVSDVSLRRMYARGEITGDEYHAELSRRRRKTS